MDDVEFGCGGTLARLIAEGVEVHYMAFSIMEESVLEPWPKDIMKTHLKDAMKRLGIPLDKMAVLDYPVRKMEYSRQEVLEDLVLAKGLIHPDLVLLPSTRDIHQDHSTVAAEGVRAFRDTTVLGYEMPWSNTRFDVGAYITLSEGQLWKKVWVLDAYESQKYRHYHDEDMIRGLAMVRGAQVKAKYAEAFEVVRWVMK